MSKRRKSRELALQVLYAREMYPDCDVENLVEYIRQENSLDKEICRYARSLVDATIGAFPQIDDLLGKHASNWDIKRMAAIDRNILRIAIAELLFFRDVPYKVVIDEAVEIAKIYGSDDSGGFVNGVIDSIGKHHILVQ